MYFKFFHVKQGMTISNPNPPGENPNYRGLNQIVESDHFQKKENKERK